MYTFHGNYYVYLCVYIVTGDYLCVFMCIYLHKKSWNCLYVGLHNGFSYELLVCYGFFIRMVCIMVFIKIVCIMVLHTNCLHNGVSYEFLVCDGFFIYIVSFKNIFNMKRGYVYAWGWGHVKMC